MIYCQEATLDKGLDVMTKLLFVFGTRPEAIKMAPVIKAADENDQIDYKVCVTAQHRELLDQVLDLFCIAPDFDLNIMRENQSLYELTGNMLTGIGGIIREYRPSYVVVHGDTTTTFTASLAAYYEKVKVAHVEAGLRTGNIYSPWPEEINRRLVGSLSEIHFAPTEDAKMNLLREGINQKSICVTGNTVIDALFDVIKLLEQDSEVLNLAQAKLPEIDKSKKIILVTGHRRENFGNGFRRICNALKIISERNDVEIIYPVHMNPNVRNTVNEMLSHANNIHLIAPLDYLPFVRLMKVSYLILTDSGGVQEEAPSLGKPVLLMRDTTERQEGVDAGGVILVGTDTQAIVREVDLLLDDQNLYNSMSKSINPYGDGFASGRIISHLLECS